MGACLTLKLAPLAEDRCQMMREPQAVTFVVGIVDDQLASGKLAQQPRNLIVLARLVCSELGQVGIEGLDPL